MPKKGEKKRGRAASAKSMSQKTSKPRIRKATRLQKRTKTKRDARKLKALPNSFKLAWQPLKIIGSFKAPLLGVLAVFALLNLIFVSGLTQSIYSVVEEIGENHGEFSAAADGFSNIILSSGGAGGSNVMRTVLFVLGSLVIIWALRHLLAGENIGIKQAYYQSMTPLVPFLLIVIVIIVHLLPMLLGFMALTIILSSLLAESAIAVTLTGALLFLLSCWSLYLISSSIFALYIVTLPDMQPVQALRSAKKLVRFRRWAVIRKLLFLPILVLFLMGAIVIPVIMYANSFVVPVYFTLSMLAILYVHTYLYNLYRGLLA